MKIDYWKNLNSILGDSDYKGFDKPDNYEIRDMAENYIVCYEPNRSILDVGCNAGILSYRLKKKGYNGKYVGIDSNPRAISKANELNVDKKNISFKLHDIEEKHLNTKFQIVYTKDVIEHLEYYEKVISNMLFMVQDLFIISFFIKPKIGKDEIRYHEDGFYLNRYGREKFIKFVNSYGFTDKSIYEDNVKDGFELMIFSKYEMGS